MSDLSKAFETIECCDTTEEIRPSVDIIKCEIESLQARIPQWISVEDRLPGINSEFLGYCDGDIDHYFRAEDCVWNRNSANQSRADIFDILSHWMPLPQPPTEE